MADPIEELDMPKALRRLVRAQHDQLLEYNRAQRRRLRSRLDDVAERIEEELADLSTSDFRAQQLRISRLLIDSTTERGKREIRQLLAEAIDDMQALSSNHLLQEIGEWFNHFGREARPINLDAMASVEDEILIEHFDRSLERYGQGVANSIRSEMAFAMASRQDVHTTTKRIQGAIKGEFWRARRIMRTETLNAYNQSHHNKLKSLDEEFDLGAKKTAIATFDARTDTDSFPVHGQVLEVDEPFVDGDGREYLHPPGRPHDREKEIPYFEDAPPNLEQGPPQTRGDQGGDDSADGSGEMLSEGDDFDPLDVDLDRVEPGSDLEDGIVDDLQSGIADDAFEGTQFAQAHRQLTDIAERRFDPAVGEDELFDHLGGVQDDLAERIPDPGEPDPEPILENLTAEELSKDQPPGNLLPEDALEIEGLDPDIEYDDLPDHMQSGVDMTLANRRREKLAEDYNIGISDQYVLAGSESEWQDTLDRIREGDIPPPIREAAGRRERVEAMQEIRDEMTEDSSGFLQDVDFDTSGSLGLDPDRVPALEEQFERFGQVVDDAVLERHPNLDGEMHVLHLKDRASYGRRLDMLNVGAKRGDDDQSRVVFHELGHWLENDDAIRDAEMQFLARRARYDRAVEIQEHTDDFESAVEDDFRDPYVGKVYLTEANGMMAEGQRLDSFTLLDQGNAGEVVSMGAQQFHSAESMADLYEDDPEHFAFALSVLRGEF